MGQLSSAFEQADTSAAYPYGAMNFIPALAIRFHWTVHLRSYFFQSASNPTAGYLHKFFYSVQNLLNFFIPREKRALFIVKILFILQNKQFKGKVSLGFYRTFRF
jgi:hypothetical protein